MKFYNFLDKFLKFVGNLFFIFLVALLVVMLFYSFYTKRYGNNGTAPLISAYVIVSPSMVPRVNVNDAVVAVRPSEKSLKENNIITFTSNDVRYPGITVTHRILNIVDCKYQTKGDNNTTPDDSLVPFESIIGKVILVIPWLGFVRAFLTRPIGWILVVAIPCVFLIIFDIIKLSISLKDTNNVKDYKFKDVEILDFDDNSSDNNSNNDNSKDGDDEIEEL